MDQDPETGHTSSTPPPTSADQDEHSTISSAISSATSTAASTASSAAETVGDYAGSAQEAVTDAAQATAASTGFSARNPIPKGPTNSIYVGNLFFDVTEDDLRKEMEQCGAVTRVKIIFDGRGLSKG